jgi:uncharacterized protein (DUF885 family)
MTLAVHRDWTRGLLVALVATSACHSPPPVSPPAPSEGASDLARLIADAGRRPPTGTLPDLTLARAERTADSARAMLQRLDRIATGTLTHEETLSFELLKWQATRATTEPEVYWYSFELLPAISPLRSVAGVLAAAPIATEPDRTAYLALLTNVGSVIDGMREKMMGQAARGIVVPREQIALSLPYVRSFAAEAGTSPLALTAPRLGGLPESVRASFSEQTARIIDTVLRPKVGALIRYVEAELAPKAPAGVGLAQYPGGKEAYRILVKRETTLDVTPERVHEIGLAAVADIEARMQRVRDSLGWKGTKAEFHEQLRRDPRFYVKTPAEVGQRLLDYVARIEPRMAEYFSVRPEARYGARRLDPALEPSMTYGYYNWGAGKDSIGYYNFNGSDLDQRSLLEAGAIAFHELVPGHHFQINLARENERLPAFRRTGMHAGYTEGWGEYASSVVAAEMGMYRDAYEIYGRLVFDAFFAVRLVVDTGMNYYGWSRQRAIDYMKEHTIESDGQIDSETWRYSTRSPAQALAYRMGRETMAALRQRAERALGAKFDIRRFHEAMLMSGSLPLFLLERHIDWWIGQLVRV